MHTIISRTTMRVFMVSLLACLPLLAGGCSSRPKHFVRPDLGIGTIKKIAVLPVENYTSDTYAADKIRKAIIAEVLSRGIDVVEPGEVTKVLADAKVKSLGSIAVKDLQTMGKTLGVEAFIMGSVETYGVSTGISASYPEVSIHLMLLEAASGNVVWSTWHTSGGAGFWTRHFGVEGRTLSETGRRVVREAIDTLF